MASSRLGIVETSEIVGAADSAANSPCTLLEPTSSLGCSLKVNSDGSFNSTSSGTTELTTSGGSGGLLAIGTTPSDTITHRCSKKLTTKADASLSRSGSLVVDSRCCPWQELPIGCMSTLVAAAASNTPPAATAIPT